MTGQEVYEILSARGVKHLHHANSVRTSISLLRLGGLASRQRVEQEHLPQTAQYTDHIDRQYGIWGNVFVDTVDIHARISNLNQYGPVLFTINTRALIDLPSTSQVLITKSNPSKWNQNQIEAQRYFLNAAELEKGFSVGTFDQMLTISTKDGIIPFGSHLQSITLDDPISRDRDRDRDRDSLEFSKAAHALNYAASTNGIQVKVTKRACKQPCKCITNYTPCKISLHFNLP